MKPFDLLLTVLFSTLVLGFGTPQSLWAQAHLENPEGGSYQSGIGVISGWKCTANRIDIVVDDTITVQAPYGTLRGDTQAVCGDANNGFGYLVNWNTLGDGQHTLRVLADGVEFARVIFTVQTLGTEFLRGASGGQTFSFNGCAVTVEWEESLQTFVISDMSACLRSLLGRFEFITTTSTGQLRNYYLLQTVVTETNDEAGVTVEGITGTDLDNNGQVVVLKFIDVVPAVLAGAAPYDFVLAAQGSSCTVFFFNQTDANTVTGVGTFLALDATGMCQPPSSTTGLTLFPMTGTKTGAALSASRSKRSAASKQPQMSGQAEAEAVRRALQVLQSIK